MAVQRIVELGPPPDLLEFFRSYVVKRVYPADYNGSLLYRRKLRALDEIFKLFLGKSFAQSVQTQVLQNPAELPGVNPHGGD